MIASKPIASTPISSGYGTLDTGLGSVELILDDGASPSIAGITATGECLFVLDDTLYVGITGASASSLYEDFILVDDSVIANIGVLSIGSIELELDSPNTAIYEAYIGSIQIELDGYSSLAYVGAYGTGESLFELFDDSYANPQTIIAYGDVLFELDFFGEAGSTIDIEPSNPVEIDTLNLPYVAYCMNTLTKGVSAYTENVNNTVPCLVATPIDQFESEERKLVHDLYLHVRSSGDVRISSLTNEMKSRREVGMAYYDDFDGLRRRRIKLPKGITGTNWQFFIENTDGADMQLLTVEPQPLLSKRKI